MVSLRPASFVVAMALVSMAAAQPRPSDDWQKCRDVRSSSRDHPHTFYSLRDDRCEGVYEENQSGSISQLKLVFLGTRLEAAPGGGKPYAHLEWPPLEGRLRILGEDATFSDRPRYRLLTEQPGDRRVYDWPGDIMVASRVAPAQVGIQATIRDAAAPAGRLYVPVRFGWATAARASGERLVEVVPLVPLESAHFTLAARVDGGWNVLQSDVPVKQAEFPAKAPFRIVLPSIDPGTYRMSIGGRSAVTNTTPTLEFWFTVPREPAR